jgi:DNA-binding transcriptional MerR regulator
MEKLVSTSEAAKILGISTQGIHYRIKKGLLKSVKKQGKVFVYIDVNDNEQKNNDINEIIKLKDEQIHLLKHIIIQNKKQYKKEIKRLEKFHFNTIETLKSEIELLKSAFVELKNIYKLENKNKLEYITLKEFIKLFQNKGYSISCIKTLIINRIKIQDNRFFYNENTKEILILKTDFSDLYQYLG